VELNLKNSTKRAIRRDISITKIFFKIVITLVVAYSGINLMNSPSWICFFGGIFCLTIAIMIWIPAVERAIKRLNEQSE
jgi:hypothetical protein